MKNTGKYFSIVLFCVVMYLFFFANIQTIKNAVSETGEINIQTVAANVTNRYPTDFSWKYSFINLNGLVHRILGQNTMNGVVRLNNGYLASTCEYKDIAVQETFTRRFAEQLKADGIEFLYVQAPCLIDKYNPQLPTGIIDYANDNADRFLEMAKEDGIEVLDLREVIRERGFDHYSLFYKTDHHWQTEGAFVGYLAVMQKLEEMLSVVPEDKVLLEDNYEKEVYPNWFLGSHAKRTGSAYGKPEDISVWYPNFETNIRVEIPDRNFSREGEFKDVVLDYSNIEGRDLFGQNPYHVYIGDEYPLVRMYNDDAACDKKVLLIKDSFALAVQAFMSESFSEIDAIDLRVFFDQSIYDYVKEMKPDVVIVLYNPYMLLNESLYDFMGEL